MSCALHSIAEQGTVEQSTGMLRKGRAIVITETDLIQNGQELIDARRKLWDLERKYKNKSSFYGEELRLARKEYSRLLKVRRALTQQAQGRMFR